MNMHVALPPVPEHYPLTRDAGEHERLSRQAAFWAPDAEALFDAAGIGAAQHVADLGCGTHDLAWALAGRVGARGRVQALDSDAALVHAQVRHGAGRPWLRFECGDAFATGWPAASLDAVHARFLAAPAGRLDDLIVEMMRVARPGGRVLLQEPDACSWQLPAAGAAWTRFLELLRAGFSHRGGDFDAGRHIGSRLRAAGAAELRLRHVVHQLPPGHPYARLPLSFCDSMRGSWLAAGLAGGDEVDTLRAALADALDHGRSDVTTFTLVQAWARA